jgi:hypothetical protein
MDALDQTKLIRDFMTRIAPEITRHTLRTVEQEVDRMYLAAGRGLGETPGEDHLAIMRNRAAGTNAQLALRWAMHLAGQFANCHDALHETQDSIAEKLKADSTLEREAEGTKR